MTLEREVDPALRAMLMSGDPFEYAHLIKFERPSRPDSNTGLPSTSSVRYTHLTDASRDIGFDDGSKNSLNGNANGSQTYIANKVISVSEVSESVEAKASNFNIVLDGNGLGADSGLQAMNIFAVAEGVYDIKIVDPTFDPVDAGFREGDKITFYNGLSGSFNIQNFRAGNIIRISKIDSNLAEGSYPLAGFRLSSEEIRSILLDKSLPEYASFINREVFIYKVYQQEGVTVGKPILLFKGIISNVSFDDNETGIKVQWGLTSHWGDFAQVKGRLSSDEFHRALDQNGNPQPQSALKPEYAYDKGFIHSETSLNILARYVVPVEKQDIKAKKGFFGIGAKVKVKKYYVNEDRYTDLDFQLQSKAIPLHYGVRNTQGFPIFADTLADDSSTVYVLYVLGEGPVGAIYDIIIDGNSLICLDKGDFDARSVQNAEGTVDLVCRGRADRGDVLGGMGSIDTTAAPINFYEDQEVDFNNRSGIFQNIIRHAYYQPYVPPTDAPANSIGITDGTSISLTSPIDMTLDFFSGKEGQRAASQLVELAKANKFKIQNDYWTGSDTAEYWGPNHTLTDTAYVLAKFKISEGETTIPTLEFVLKSKVIDCYNYDYSYAHYDKVTGENAANFNLGDVVSLYRADNNQIINSSVQIIDKWTFVNGDGITETRFRYSQPPALGYNEGTPSITRFYMQAAGGQRWNMMTYNYVEYTATITTEMAENVTPVGDGPLISFPLPPMYDTPQPVFAIADTPLLVPGRFERGGLTGVHSYNTIMRAL